MSSSFPPRGNVKLVYQGIGSYSPPCLLVGANDLVCFLTKAKRSCETCIAMRGANASDGPLYEHIAHLPMRLIGS